MKLSPPLRVALSLKSTDLADIFKGLGRMEGKLHLEVDDSVSPVVMPPRRVPVALKGKFYAYFKDAERGTLN